VDLLSFSILTDGKYLMPATNQPIFRSNAIKHYMQGREKHEFPRFISLPITILLWILLALFVIAAVLVWDEQVPTYATTQGIVVVQSTTQPSGKSTSATGKQVPAMGKSTSATGKQVPAMGKSTSATGKLVPAISKQAPPMAIAVFFFPPAQAQNLHIGTPVSLHVGPSGSQFSSQIAGIEPGVMSPDALRALFHLENTSLPITQPSTVVIVKLDPTFATEYAGSTMTADLQVGSQRLISFLPGVGSLFGN
jgi:hypothetical protein